MDDGNLLRGRRVAIVGGSSGVGFAVAEMAARHGAEVTILARDAARLEAAAKSIGDVRFHTVDLREIDSVLAAADAIGALDHLVVTAGVFAPATLAESTVDDWRRLLDERLVGPLALIKALAPAISSSIVMFSGTVARRPLPGTVWHAIAASGMESAVRALAIDLAPIRVNAVAPGAVDTPMLANALGEERAAVVAKMTAELPARRIGTAEDVAEAVMLAMTNKFMTGTTIEIDGGAVLI